MTEENEVVLNAQHGGEISENGGDHCKVKSDHCNGEVVNGNVGGKDAGESVVVADSGDSDPFVIVDGNGSVTEEEHMVDDAESEVTVTVAEQGVSEVVNADDSKILSNGETTIADVVVRESESGSADGQNGSGSLVVSDAGDELKSVQNGVPDRELNEIREDVADSVAEGGVTDSEPVVQNGVAADDEIRGDVDVSKDAVAAAEGDADVSKSDREAADVQNGVVEEIVDSGVEGESVVDSDVQGRSESVSDEDHKTLQSEDVVDVGEDEKRIVTNGSHSVKLESMVGGVEEVQNGVADSEPIECAEGNEIPVDEVVSATTSVKESAHGDAQEGLEKEPVESVSDTDAGIQNGSAQVEKSEYADENKIPVEGELERSGEESAGHEVVHEADIIGDGNGNTLESEGEPSVDLGESNNNGVENEAEASNNAVESEGEPSVDASETRNNAVENVAEPSYNAAEFEGEPSNKALEGEAEPSKDAVENGFEPSNNAVVSEAEPLNKEDEGEAEPSIDAVENGVESSHDAVEREAEPSSKAVEGEAEPSNDAVENGVEPSNNAVESVAEPSNNAVEAEAETSNNAVEAEAEPSNNAVQGEAGPSNDTGESEAEPSKSAVENEADPSSDEVKGEAEPSNDAEETEAEPSKSVVENEAVPSSDAVKFEAEPSNDAVQNEVEPLNDTVEREGESSKNTAEFEAVPSNNVVQSEVEPSVDVPDIKTKAGESESEPPVEGEASNRADEDPIPAQEGSTTDTLDGLNMGTEVVRKPFYYLIRLPRYDDDENIKEQIKNALRLVDEKTKIRDVIRAETQTKKAICKEYNQEFRDALSEERAARDLLKSKRQEMDSVQSTMNRLNNAISVGDIDGKIRNMEHMIEHETLPLKEEKQLIRQIKQLKQNREELSAIIAKQDQSHQLDDKDSIEEHFKQSQLLKKEMELLRNNVHKAEAATKAARKKYDEECNKLSELLAQFKAADDVRQEAYVKLQALRKQLHGKSKYFFEYKDAINKAQDLAVEGKKEELQSFCIDQVERIMELWNKNDEFRRDYLRCNTRSTLRRLQTPDGRSLGPDEEPHVIPSSFTERAIKSDSLVSQSTLRQEKKSTPTESVKPKDEPVPKAEVQRTETSQTAKETSQTAKETSQTAKAIKPTQPAPSVVAARRWGDESDEDTVEKPVRTKEEEELILKAEMARKEEEAAKLKEMRRLEEIEKAKEALQRKKRNAEKAQQRAALKAQKEAEQKEKEREKRAKKKEKRKGAASTDTAAANTEQEPAPSSETLSRTSEECDQIEKPVEVTKRSLKPSQFIKQTKVKPLPMAIRNRGKRRLQPWMWAVIAVLAVIALFFVGNSSSLRSSLQGFGF